MPKGSVLTFEDLEGKKPADYGIPASQYRSVIGKELKKDLTAYDFIQYEDVD